MKVGKTLEDLGQYFSNLPRQNVRKEWLRNEIHFGLRNAVTHNEIVEIAGHEEDFGFRP